MMTKPHVVESGEGRSVLCLHSSLSSSRQWTSLMEQSAAEARVVATDLYGYGKTSAWGRYQPMSLDDEVDLLESVVNDLDERFDLVGHSYGGAVAAKLALRFPHRIRSLVLFEPVLFSLLFQDDIDHRAVTEVALLRQDVSEAVQGGDFDRAASRFINYWSGTGTWSKLDAKRRSQFATAMPSVIQNFSTMDTDKTPLTAYRNLEVPTLLLYGKNSRVSTLHVVDILSRLLPSAAIHGLKDVGHMGPITHAPVVNEWIINFQREVDYIAAAA